MNYPFREEPSLERTVTFILNREKPVYNWFYFKEGYSKELVDYCIDKYSLKGTIADPFCGSGTTLLAAKERGFSGIGIDVSPLANLVSKVKTRNYDFEELSKDLLSLRSVKTGEGQQEKQKENWRVQKWVKNYFYGRTLDNILAYMEAINSIESEYSRDFFTLALIDSTGRAANAVKIGGSLRRVKKPPIPMKYLFINKAKRMLKDIKRNPALFSGIEPEVINADSRTIEWKPESLDAVITSPPYMNKIEYTSVYRLELALFFGEQETRLRAFVSDSGMHEGSDTEGPIVEKAYFDDLKKVLENLYSGVKKNGTVIFELAGGCFPDRNIEADERIAEIGEEIGFKCKEIVEARKIQCHRERTFRTGTVRESLVILKK